MEIGSRSDSAVSQRTRNPTKGLDISSAAYSLDHEESILLRIILIVLAALILYRLLSSLFRLTSRKPPREMPKKKRPGKEVGEGWIVDDKIDGEQKEE